MAATFIPGHDRDALVPRSTQTEVEILSLSDARVVARADYEAWAAEWTQDVRELVADDEYTPTRRDRRLAIVAAQG